MAEVDLSVSGCYNLVFIITTPHNTLHRTLAKISGWVDNIQSVGLNNIDILGPETLTDSSGGKTCFYYFFIINIQISGYLT